MDIGRLGYTTGRGIYGMARAVAWVSGICIVAMMFLTFTDVFFRYVLNRPIKGTIDITVVMIIVLSFLAFGYAQVTKSHITIEIVTSRLSKDTNTILAAFNHFLAMGVFGLMAWALGTRAWGYALAPETAPISQLLHIPYLPFMFVAAIGAAILCLVLIVDFACSLSRALGSS